MKKLKEKNRADIREQLRWGLILRAPALFEDVKKSIEQIYALINTYIARKDYQVIKNGLNAIYSVVSQYIEVRQGTFFPSIPFFTPPSQKIELSHDDFLNDVFEKLSALQRVASKNKDLELSKEIIECFSKIAIRCTEIRYRIDTVREYTHCMLAVQYMQNSIEDSLNTDLLDIGIDGSQNQKNIGLRLINNNATTDIRMIIDNLFKIAMYGIAKPKAAYLISYPLQVYSIFLRAFVFDKNAYDKYLPKYIFKKVQSIVDMYIKFKNLGNSDLSVDLQYSLGAFVDLSNPIAMPHIFNEAYIKIKDKETKKDDKNDLIRKILYLSHEIWHFYDELSKSAAQKESFLIHFIDSNLHYISMVLLNLYQSNGLEGHQKEKILENIDWIISDYWRIYDYHKKISQNYEMQILENLLQIGYKFHKLSLTKQLGNVIKIIVSIAETFSEKQENSYGGDPIYIVERAAYLCILADSDVIKSNFVAMLKVKLWKNYLKKYPRQKNLLFKELSEIDPSRLRVDRIDFFEDSLLSQLDKKNIDAFVCYLRKQLKK